MLWPAATLRKRASQSARIIRSRFVHSQNSSAGTPVYEFKVSASQVDLQNGGTLDELDRPLLRLPDRVFASPTSPTGQKCRRAVFAGQNASPARDLTASGFAACTRL